MCPVTTNTRVQMCLQVNTLICLLIVSHSEWPFSPPLKVESHVHSSSFKPSRAYISQMIWYCLNAFVFLIHSRRSAVFLKWFSKVNWLNISRHDCKGFFYIFSFWTGNTITDFWPSRDRTAEFLFSSLCDTFKTLLSQWDCVHCLGILEMAHKEPDIYNSPQR